MTDHKFACIGKYPRAIHGRIDEETICNLPGILLGEFLSILGNLEPSFFVYVNRNSDAYMGKIPRVRFECRDSWNEHALHAVLGQRLRQ